MDSALAHLSLSLSRFFARALASRLLVEQGERRKLMRELIVQVEEQSEPSETGRGRASSAELTPSLLALAVSFVQEAVCEQKQPVSEHEQPKQPQQQQAAGGTAGGGVQVPVSGGEKEPTIKEQGSGKEQAVKEKEHLGKEQGKETCACKECNKSPCTCTAGISITPVHREVSGLLKEGTGEKLAGARTTKHRRGSMYERALTLSRLLACAFVPCCASCVDPGEPASSEPSTIAVHEVRQTIDHSGDDSARKPKAPVDYVPPEVRRDSQHARA